MGQAEQLGQYNAEAEQRSRLSKGEEKTGSEADMLAEDLVRDVVAVLRLSEQKRQPVRFLGFSISATSWLNTRYQLMAYMSVKLLQLVNVYGQLRILDRLISVGDMRYLDWVPNRLTGGWWSGKPNREDITLFGLRVMCRIVTPARPGNLGDNETHDMACDLAINPWNGVFYSFYWAWSILLIVLTVLSLMGVLLMMVPYIQRRRVKLMIRGNGYEDIMRADLREFVKNGLGWSKSVHMRRL